MFHSLEQIKERKRLQEKGIPTVDAKWFLNKAIIEIIGEDKLKKVFGKVPKKPRNLPMVIPKNRTALGFPVTQKKKHRGKH